MQQHLKCSTWLAAHELFGLHGSGNRARMLETRLMTYIALRSQQDYDEHEELALLHPCLLIAYHGHCTRAAT